MIAQMVLAVHVPLRATWGIIAFIILAMLCAPAPPDFMAMISPIAARSSAHSVMRFPSSGSIVQP